MANFGLEGSSVVREALSERKKNVREGERERIAWVPPVNVCGGGELNKWTQYRGKS